MNEHTYNKRNEIKSAMREGPLASDHDRLTGTRLALSCKQLDNWIKYMKQWFSDIRQQAAHEDDRSLKEILKENINLSVILPIKYYCF